MVRAGDQLRLHEGHQTRHIPNDETLIHVAGIEFELDQFECPTPNTEHAPQAPFKTCNWLAKETLASEMQRDGVAMKRWLQACSDVSRWITEQMLTVADEPWWQIEGLWADESRYLSAYLALSSNAIRPSLCLDFGSYRTYGEHQVIGTLAATWLGNRMVDANPTLLGRRVDLGAWWQMAGPWCSLPVKAIESVPFD